MSSNVSVQGNLFKDNSASTDGGAIAATTVLTCGKNQWGQNTFHNNTAQRGGAIIETNSSICSNNDVFLGNTGIDGGALFLIDSNSNYAQENFTENEATAGAGIFITMKVSDTNIITVVSNSSFVKNWALREGGGIYCDSASANLIGNTFVDNRASDARTQDSSCSTTCLDLNKECACGPSKCHAISPTVWGPSSLNPTAPHLSTGNKVAIAFGIIIIVLALGVGGYIFYKKRYTYETLK